MRLNRVLVLREQQLQNAAFCKESFVFTCLTYKKLCPAFSEWADPQILCLKAGQISKIHASSHEYPHVEKNQESS